jgi:hypothetical protein
MNVIHLKLLVLVHRIGIVSIGSAVFVGVGVDVNGGLAEVVGRMGGMIEVKVVVGILDSGSGFGFDFGPDGGSDDQTAVMDPTSCVECTLLLMTEEDGTIALWSIWTLTRDGDGGETRL